MVATRAGAGVQASGTTNARRRRAPSVAAALRAAGGRGAAVAAWLAGSLDQELEQRAGFQWLAVAFGAGCLVYFGLPREPALAALLPAMFAAAVGAALGCRRGGAWRLLALVALLLAGATAAKLRVERLRDVAFERSLTVPLSGRVIDVERREQRRPRIILDRPESADLPVGALPRRVRVSLAPNQDLPPLGARIGALVRLSPVPGPVVPGGYDPRRAAFFDGIGAGGFMLGGWTLVEPAVPRSAALAVARLRAALVARIVAVEPGEAGAVAAALLVGERSGLSEATNESLRLSGLAHILSISGLHMMLIAGTAFFAVRALLALSPPLALRQPIRKWAAAAALLVVTFYLVISGGGIATVRAYVMAVVMFAAILVDRPAISMRNLALAAFIVLLREPESITEPGFQMSFGAVAALIAGWDAWQQRRRRRLADDDVLPGLRLLRLAGKAVAAAAVTTLLAGLATAPFSAYHFERVANYSLLGNLLATPLVSLLIMPVGLLALAMMPVGLEAVPLRLMARGIDLLLAISGWVAGLPGAETRAPGMPPASLLLVSAGMIWLCLWRLRWRLLGLPLIAGGLLAALLLRAPPDLLVAPDGRALALRGADGALRVSGSRAGSYAAEQFLDEERVVPAAERLREGVRCDELACLLEGAQGLLLAHVRDAAAFPEDCRRAHVVVTPLPAPADCAAQLTIDAAALQAFGAHAAMIEERDGRRSFVLRTERRVRPRPWQAGGLQAGRPGTSGDADPAAASISAAGR